MAASNRDIGLWGEQVAVEYLHQKGWTIEKTNWVFKKWEIDIIARNESLLVFVEVKTRKNNRFGYPEQFVSPNKAILIKNAATEYTRSIQFEGFIRFDIIAITGRSGQYDLLHLEDAF